MKKKIVALLIATMLLIPSTSVFGQEVKTDSNLYYQMNVACVNYVYGHSQGYRYESADEILADFDIPQTEANVKYVTDIVLYLENYQKGLVK